MEIQFGILPQKGCVGIFMSTTSDFSLMINGLVSGFFFVKSYCSCYSQIGWGSCKFKSSHLILVDDLISFFCCSVSIFNRHCFGVLLQVLWVLEGVVLIDRPRRNQITVKMFSGWWFQPL